MAQEYDVVIRRCNSNRDCWGAYAGKNEFMLGTSYSIDELINRVVENHGPMTITLHAKAAR